MPFINYIAAAVAAVTLSVFGRKSSVDYVNRSTDGGVTWAQANPSGLEGQPNLVVKVGGTLIVACEGASTSFYKSTDGGVTWSAVTGSPTVSRGLAYDGVATLVSGSGVSSNVVWNSTDGGVTWNSLGSKALQIGIPFIGWAGSVFVSLSSTANTLASSPDGNTWTNRNTIAGIGSCQGFAYSGTKAIVFPAGGGTNAFVSTDGGTSWSSKALGASCWCQRSGAIYANGKFVAVTWTDVCFYSADDGVTWNTSALPTSGGWSSVAWDGTQFIACSVGPTNFIATSPDAVTWTARTASDIDATLVLTSA